MTNYGGFPYSFPLYFGAGSGGVGEAAEVGDMFLSDFDEELIFNLIKENPRSRTRTIRNYYTPQSDYPSTIKEEIGTKELSFFGFFDYSLVESKHIRERKLDYFLRSNNKLLLISIPRDYATFFNLKNIGDVDDASFRDIDTFNMDGSAEKHPLGQMRLAVDSRCSTDGAKKGDNGAMQNRAVQLDALNEYVSFNLTQSNLKLPVGNYEYIIRAKAEQADTVKIEVLNLDDTDEWASIYTPGAVNITCLKAFKEKLYAGTSDGKIYVTEDGENFSLAFNTGEAEVHCLEEYEDCLYAGTGNNGKIFKYDEAAWILDKNTGETDVFYLKGFHDTLYAGTGANGKIFGLKIGCWMEKYNLNESSVFSLEKHNNTLYAGTGANGKIYRLDYYDPSDFPYSAHYSTPGSQPSGLAWDGTNIWSCDKSTGKIYKHNGDMTVHTEYTPSGVVAGYKPSGLAWDGTNIWSCDPINDKIYKHDVGDPNLAVLNTYNSPDTQPSGLAWDGTNIWSCDRSTYKIYKHDTDIINLLATYDAIGSAPTGLAWDGYRIWSCDKNTDKIYKHNTDITVDYSYSEVNITGLAFDGSYMWFCRDTIVDWFFKGAIHFYEVSDTADTNIYTLKSFEDTLYAGGDGGNVYKTSDGDSWSTDYATGETEIRSFLDLGGKLYAGTGNNGKLYVLNGVWSLSKDLDDNGIYAGVSWGNHNFIGTGANGNIYTYRNGILAGEQKILTTSYALYKLPFRITNLDIADSIQFKVTKDGSVAAWANIDFLCFVATR